jgi:GNAT superfamily N-acetyltransferase
LEIVNPFLSKPTMLHTSTPQFRRLTTADLVPLLDYLHGLSEETRQRFGPHPFDHESVSGLFIRPDEYYGFIANDPETSKIIAYSIVKQGFLEHDRPRLETYGLHLDPLTDATLAPSVADAWQGKGMGTRMFHELSDWLKARGVQRIILWGGVQCSNDRAVRYYQKLGFTVLGEFEYYGRNFDMVKTL